MHSLLFVLGSSPTLLFSAIPISYSLRICYAVDNALQWLGQDMQSAFAPSQNCNYPPHLVYSTTWSLVWVFPLTLWICKSWQFAAGRYFFYCRQWNLTYILVWTRAIETAKLILIMLAVCCAQFTWLCLHGVCTTFPLVCHRLSIC